MHLLKSASSAPQTGQSEFTLSSVQRLAQVHVTSPFEGIEVPSVSALAVIGIIVPIIHAHKRIESTRFPFRFRYPFTQNFSIAIFSVQ